MNRILEIFNTYFCNLRVNRYLIDDIEIKMVNRYERKMKVASTKRGKSYYFEGMKLLFRDGENEENYITILQEYNEALVARSGIIDKLNAELKEIKKLKI